MPAQRSQSLHQLTSLPASPFSLPPPQVLVGNKSDMDESKRAVAYSRGQALADEFKMQFFETSAKSNTNVDEVFQVDGGVGGRVGERLVCEWDGWVGG